MDLTSTTQASTSTGHAKELEISGPFNVKPGPSSHLNTQDNAIRIVRPSSPPTTPPPHHPADEESRSPEYEFAPIRIPITYPARRPLSAVEEETMSAFIHSPASTSGGADLSTPELTADDLLNSALEDSLGSSTSRDSAEFTPVEETAGDLNALGLSMMASGSGSGSGDDTDEDERRAELHVGFGTIGGSMSKKMASLPRKLGCICPYLALSVC